MSENTYKPIRLTKGKTIDYAALLRQPPTAIKTINAKTHGPAEELARLGIKGETTVDYKKDKDGNLILDSHGKPVTVTQFTPTEIPDWFTHAIMVLSGFESCYFEGCDQIVENYKAELKRMEERPGGCRSCDKARLKRKYSAQFRDALPPNEVNRIARPSIPPHTVTNLSTNETVVVPRKPAPYTIRREVPQAIKEAFTKRATEGKLVVNGREIPIHELRELQQQQEQVENTGTTTDTGGSSSS